MDVGENFDNENGGDGTEDSADDLNDGNIIDFFVGLEEKAGSNGKAVLGKKGEGENESKSGDKSEIEGGGDNERVDKSESEGVDGEN